MIYLFHRDLRIADNIALNEAITTSKDTIMPIFVFDPRQIGKSNEYRGGNSLQFMLESLNSLKKILPQLQFFYGDPAKLLSRMREEVVHMEDYTQFAKRRHKEISRAVRSCREICDVFLNPSLKKINSQTYHAFYSRAKGEPILRPTRRQFKKVAKITSKYPKMSKYEVKLVMGKSKYVLEWKNAGEKKTILNIAVNRDRRHFGGREMAKKQIARLATLGAYNKDREKFSFRTSGLSPYIKFGNVSIREVYYAAKKHLRGATQNAFIRQLYWNNFFIALQHNHRTIQRPLKPLRIKWNTNSTWFEKWKNAQTGIPILDACMAELNATGYLHNRGRLIAANGLCKWLLINWTHGEKYFAQKLTDYDPMQNNGNWAYVAGFGVDYLLRVYNLYQQGRKYDPEATYIKKWLPQLSDLPAHIIHNWWNTYRRYDLEKLGYYVPLVWNPSKRFHDVKRAYEFQTTKKSRKDFST